MGLHVARQLLDAALLTLAALPTTGANVFRNRPDGRPLIATELPGLLVYLGGEDVSNADIAGGILLRVQRLRVGIRVKSTAGADDILCAIRAEVESALAPTLAVGPGAKAILLDYTGLADPEFDGNTEQEVVSAELEFSAQLYTSAPDVLL